MRSRAPATFVFSFLSLVVLLVPAAGCAGGDGGRAVSVEALPNGGERVRNPAVGQWQAGEEWRLVPELRLGRVEGEGPDVFASIGSLEVRDGRLYVVERQAREVRVFDLEGNPLRTFGGPGQGPGEFALPDAVVVDAEGMLWVPDGRAQRYSRFDTTGVLLEDRPRPSVSWHFEGGFDPEGRLWDSDLVGGPQGVNPLLAGAGLPGGGRPILRTVFALDGAEVGDTLPIPEPPEPPEPFSTEDGRTRVGVPFVPRVHFTFDPRGYVWSGNSGEYRIVQRSLSNDTVRIIERAYTPLPVTSADIDAWLERMARIRDMGLRVDRSRIPPTKPIFDGLIVGEDGALWVRLVTEGDETVFDVFDAEGRYLGPVNAGAGLASVPLPVLRDGALWAVVRDELDVQYITRLQVVKGS